MDDAPVIYGLEDFQARALVAQTAETEKINFLVGTQSLRLVNQVQLIEFDDDTSLVSKQAFEHPAGEIWKIASAPQTPDLIATVYNSSEDYQSEFGAALWKLPIDLQPGVLEGRASVEHVCTLVSNDGPPLQSVGTQAWSLVWAPEQDSRLVTLADNKLKLWDLQESGHDAKVVSEACVEGRSGLGVGRWYPHQQASQVAATHGCGVIAWDIRSMTTAWTINNAHQQMVRDLDFNPNKQYYMATCGDDCATNFWDVRNIQQPLLQLTDHSHWVWSVRFNASYDQLVVTCSSDQRVILSNLPSIASQPFGTLVDQDDDIEKLEKDKSEVVEDGVIQTYDDHEDSVYAVEWSAADFWTFASISYDGRLVINKVPKSVKYKQFM